MSTTKQCKTYYDFTNFSYQIISTISHDFKNDLFSDEDKSDEELTEEEKQQKAIDAVIKDIMERLAIIAVTQPLQVVTIRAMASFVGNENEYSNVLTGLASIYRENGILGKSNFFSSNDNDIYCNEVVTTLFWRIFH